MAERDIQNGSVPPLVGLILLAASPIAFLALLVVHIGWWVLVFPALALTTFLGWRMATVRGNGSAGAREREAGMPYAVELDPDDPDAGVPRRSA